jgi:hypothetical protein
MSFVSAMKNAVPLARTIRSTPQLLKVNPSLLWFLSGYMNKFRIREVDNQLILHSHLPPLNSPAYSRFVKEHLILRTQGPSHAQIGLTNTCPQNCAYCYNKNRKGKVMDKDTIIDTARDLKQMGVVWLGFTGGEPLLNKDIVEITDSISSDCAIKLFTTGCTLTRDLASDLKHAGVSPFASAWITGLQKSMMWEDDIKELSGKRSGPSIYLRVWTWMWEYLQYFHVR